MFITALNRRKNHNLITSGLSGRWLCDGTAQDSSGAGNHGTIIGSPTLVTAPLGTGLLFDTIAKYVELPALPFVANTVGSLCAWIKLSNTLMADGSAAIFSFGGGVKALAGLFTLNIRRFTVVDAGTHFGTTQRSDGGSSVSSGMSSTSLVVNTWYHVCATSDGSTYTYYVNGISETINWSGAAGINDGDWIGDTAVTGTAVQRIGEIWYNGAAAGAFPGAICDLRHYSRTLTANEVLALAQGVG